MKAHAPRDRTAQHRTCADSGLDARVLRCRWRHRARDTSICNSKAPCAAPSTSSLNALHRVPIPWRRSSPRTRKLSQRIAGSHSRVPSSVTTQAHQCDPFQQTAQRLSPGLRPDAPDHNRVAGRRASPRMGRLVIFLRCLRNLKARQMTSTPTRGGFRLQRRDSGAPVRDSHFRRVRRVMARQSGTD